MSIDPLIHALVEIGSEQPDNSIESEATTTEEVVVEMLTENTGRHMLDSGGAYGRSWERNQGRDFASEPAVVVEATPWGVDVTVNLYHWLVDTLDYEPELDRRWLEFATTGERKREPWHTCMEEFFEMLQGGEAEVDEEFPETADGWEDFRASIDHNPWTGEDWRSESRWSENTYNHDSMLSQVIQYTMLGDLVFLEVHGGADVRGGYTKPRIFRAYEEWPSFIDAGRRVTLYCDAERCIGDEPGQNTHWETDDAYNFYFMEMWSGASNLNDLDLLNINEPEGFGAWRARAIVREVLQERAPEMLATPMEPKALFTDPDTKNIHCPVCAAGILQGGW